MLQMRHELVWKSMDAEHEKQKTYYDPSACGPQNEICDLVMVFNPTTKTGQTKKIKYFYSETQIIREIVNDLTHFIQ